MHRRLLSAAATSALLLGLAACGEPTDGPVTTPPPRISVSGPSDGGGDAEPSDRGGETAEPTAEAPNIPPPDPADFAGMEEHTAEGAEQAFRYYIALTYWGYETGISGNAETLYGPDCSGCQELTRQIKEVHKSGTYWSELDIEPTSTTSHDSKNYEFEISHTFILGEHSTQDPNSGESQSVPEQEYSAIGGLNWDGSRWIVDGLSIKGI